MKRRKPMAPLTRRMFLRGAAGASLAIPFLPSLLPRHVHAQEDNEPRLVGVGSRYGTFRQNWEVDMRGETQIEPNAWKTSLSSIDGPISRTLDGKFDGLRSKMAVFQGLDGTSGGGHNQSFPFSGSTHSGGSDAYDSRPHHPYSLDTVVERAPEFYGDAPPPVPVLRSAPAYRGDALLNISWYTDESESFTLPYERNAATLFSGIFTGGEPMEDPNALRIRAMDRVLEDYRRVQGHRRLSLEDRRRLENYGDLVQGLSGRLERTRAVSCIGPTQLDTSGAPLSDVYTNHIDIMVASLACSVTRVAMLWIPDHDDLDSSQSIFHGWSHGRDDGGGAGTDLANEANMLAAYDWIGGRVAELLTKLDAVEMPGGSTLLDQSAVLWSNELGGAQHHTNIGTPVMVAGSAGGRLRTDVAYDFRARPRRLWAGRNDFPPLGRPYNQLLISLLSAMGLARSSWQNQGPGFGDYGAFENSYTGGAYDDFRGREADPLPDFLLPA
ncbi:MAG: hypothetical protein ACI9KE_005805 [Polyangiales bacterium]|jgi:hypothetical protein